MLNPTSCFSSRYFIALKIFSPTPPPDTLTDWNHIIRSLVCFIYVVSFITISKCTSFNNELKLHFNIFFQLKVFLLFYLLAIKHRKWASMPDPPLPKRYRSTTFHPKHFFGWRFSTLFIKRIHLLGLVVWKGTFPKEFSCYWK